MAEELFYGPTVAVIGTFCVLNAIYCCLSVRRIRRVEQRVHALESIQISSQTTRTEPVQPPVQVPTATPYSPPATYIRPATYANPAATYSYYQQPTAPTYYPQDPQSLYK